MNEKLNELLIQTREIHDFIEGLENAMVIEDNYIEERIYDATVFLDSAALCISEMIGRETLSVNFYGSSSFKPIKKGGEK